MPIFYHSTKKYLLFTSYKVMYSTLKAQNSLREVGRRKVLSSLFSDTKRLQLVRNPYDRFISYFENKLRRSPINKMAGHDKKDWELGQSLVLNIIGASRANLNSEARALIELKIDELVSIIPKLWHKDLHLAPQHKSMNIFGSLLTIEPDSIIKIEELTEEHGASIGLDLTIRKNQTNYDKPIREYYNKFSQNKIYDLYKSDFIKYDYSKEL